MNDIEKTNLDEAHIKANFEKRRRKINWEDFDRIIEKTEDILDKFRHVPILGKHLKSAPTMLGIIKDYINGNYKEVPYSSIVTIAAALVYLISPIDLIPDVIPVIGYLDDAVVIGFVLETVSNDLEDYRIWRDSHKVS